MDPITLIVTALAAGAALGITDTASSAIKDAYAALKTLVRKRLGGRPDAELVLAKHEQAPQTWRAPLMAELDEAGARAGKYAVDARGAQGVQIGDRNTQHNVFSTPPGGPRPPDSGSSPS